MKRFFLVMFGLAMVAVCAGWFLGFLEDTIDSAMGIRNVEGAANEFATSAARKAERAKRVIGGLDLNTVLNAANAIIGFIGLLVTYRASRPKVSDHSSA